MSLPTLALRASLALLLAAPAWSQTWVRTVPESAAGYPGLAVSATGSTTLIVPTQTDTRVVTLDTNGDVAASLSLSGYFGELVQLCGALYSSTGDLVVCGSNQGEPFLAALDPANGFTRWSQSFVGEEGALRSVTELAGGGYAATGDVTLYAPSYRTYPILVAVASNGATLFSRDYGDPGRSQFARTIRARPNGNLLHCLSGGSIVVEELDPAGNVVWRRDLTSTDSIGLPRCDPSPDGGAFVFGVAEYADNLYDFLCTKLDAAGDVVWSKRYQTLPDDPFNLVFRDVLDVRSTADGGCLVAVLQPVTATPTQRDIAFLKLDSLGEVEWYDGYGDPLSNEQLGDAFPTPDGGMIATTQQPGFGVRAVRIGADGLAGPCLPLVLSAFDFPITLTVTDDSSFAAADVVDTGFTYTMRPLADSATSNLICGLRCSASGSTFGAGLAGAGGFVPAVAITDGACLGYTPTLTFDDVVGGTFGVLAFSLNTVTLPAFGGQIYVDPTSLTLVGLVTDGTPGVAGAGSASFQIPVDLTPLAGLPIYGQGVFRDTAAPKGWSLSSGLTVLAQ